MEGFYMGIKNSRKAFTLAEVLITLGIIGVVAAMTLPSLIVGYQKRATETKVKTFYSKINQAIQLSIAAGNNPTGSVIDGKYYSYNENLEYLKMFIYPYLKVSEYFSCYEPIFNHHGVCSVMQDGGVMLFYIDQNGGDIIYYPSKNDMQKTDNIPRHRFWFEFEKTWGKAFNASEYVAPYGASKNMSSNDCTYGCSRCFGCTTLLAKHGWKFTKDYPW